MAVLRLVGSRTHAPGAPLTREFSRRHCGEVALTKNEDGTQSYITIDPGIAGIEFVRDGKAFKPTLILCDAQHKYRFVAP